MPPNELVSLNKLRAVAAAARGIFEQCCQEQTDSVFAEFPTGACGPAAELLARYLVDAFQLPALYVFGRRPADGWTHAWVTVDDVVIDITADQFKQRPIIVTRANRWHRKE